MKPVVVSIGILPELASDNNDFNDHLERKGTKNEFSFKLRLIKSEKHFPKMQFDGLSCSNRQSPIMSNSYNFHVEMHLQWELACCLRLELWRSKAFQRGFVSWLLDNVEKRINPIDDACLQHEKLSTRNCDYSRVLVTKFVQNERTDFQNKNEEKSRITVDLIPFVPLKFRNVQPELIWSCLVLPLVLQRFYLEYILACLSTLGGAYSSLGENSKTHANVAGKISLKQLAVASKLANPILASHCRLYHAHSLMQTGKFNAAARIIRNEFTIASSSLGKSEPKLLVCCKAAWARLRYFQKKASGKLEKSANK